MVGVFNYRGFGIDNCRDYCKYSYNKSRKFQSCASSESQVVIHNATTILCMPTGSCREVKIDMLESKLIEMTRVATNIEPLLEKAVSNLAHLDILYKEGDVRRKRMIIGSIYPEKLTFDGFQYRTTRINEAVELIYTLDKGFSQKETGQTAKVFDLSCLVVPTGIKLNSETLC